MSNSETGSEALEARAAVACKVKLVAAISPVKWDIPIEVDLPREENPARWPQETSSINKYRYLQKILSRYPRACAGKKKPYFIRAELEY